MRIDILPTDLSVGFNTGNAMKKITLLTLFLAFMTPIAGVAEDFWTECGNRLTYNYSIKTNFQTQETLSNQELLGIATKSFSQSFGTRFSNISKQNSFLGLVCAFSKEPEKCFVDIVMNDLFDEIQIINAPEISQNILNKTRATLKNTMFDNTSYKNKVKRSSEIPKNKIFNPKFGIEKNTLTPVVKFPFFTYYGIYVEPQIDINKSFTLSLMKNRMTLDITEDYTILKYQIPKQSFLKKDITISYSAGNITLETRMFVW